MKYENKSYAFAYSILPLFIIGITIGIYLNRNIIKEKDIIIQELIVKQSQDDLTIYNLQQYKKKYLQLKILKDGVDVAMEFIPKLEGFRSCPYWDVDHYSIGYGTRSGKHNACIDKYEARKLMVGEVWFIAVELIKNYPHLLTLDKNVFASVISFRYNLGVGKFNNTYLAYALKHKADADIIIAELQDNRKDKKRGEREHKLASWGDKVN